MPDPRPASSTPSRPRPMAGLNVLDFTAFVAGPYASRLMADMGANVIKVEPPEGETLRGTPPVSNGMSGFFAALNLGKRSITLNLKTERGIALARELAAKCDVIFENFRPGVMKRLGLDYETLSKDRPGLIYCSISGYGQTGPDAGRPAFAPIINAASGYTLAEFRYQRATDKPERSRTIAADVLGANHALIAIMTALYRRERTGEGDYIDVELLAGLMNMIPFEIQEAQFPVEKLNIPIFDPIRATDGYFVVAPVTQKNFHALAEACGKPEWMEDPRFATGPARMAHWGELFGAVEEWAQDKTAQDAARACEAAGCPARRYLTPAQALQNPHMLERGSIVEVTDQMGPHKVVNTPFRFTNAEAGVTTGAPTLGAGTHEVLADLLGYDPGQIAALKEDGVI
ncbi:CaiB/BaiF CoA transferase family protein [Minwuia sp.]|uniref:CaiB/BaiF CoA transferase family protein n=1 Tax=Minwuia sp. TaxID=2493630 RepID=UPI003A954F65